jgi:hypothetical protein
LPWPANRLLFQSRKAGNSIAKQIVFIHGAWLTPASWTTGNSVRWDNPARPPLLITAGSEDRTITPRMANANHEKAKAAPLKPSFQEFPGRGQFLMVQDGW